MCVPRQVVLSAATKQDLIRGLGSVVFCTTNNIIVGAALLQPSGSSPLPIASMSALPLSYRPIVVIIIVYDVNKQNAKSQTQKQNIERITESVTNPRIRSHNLTPSAARLAVIEYLYRGDARSLCRRLLLDIVIVNCP